MEQLIVSKFFEELFSKHCNKETSFPSEVLTYRFSMYGISGTYEGADVKNIKRTGNDHPVLAKNEDDGTLRIVVFRERPKYGYNGHPIPTLFEIIQKGPEVSYTAYGFGNMMHLRDHSMIETPYPEVNQLFSEVRDYVLQQ